MSRKRRNGKNLKTTGPKGRKAGAAMSTVNTLQGAVRLCRCGGMAHAIETSESTGEFGMTPRLVGARMKCDECGRTFNARIGRFEEWAINRRSEIEFFIRRKEWARELLRNHSLTEPGQSIEGEFEGQAFEVRIGPRRGVRIREK